MDTRAAQYRLFETNVIGSDANMRGNQQIDDDKYEDALGSYATALDQAEGEKNDEHGQSPCTASRARMRTCAMSRPHGGGVLVIQNYSALARFLLSSGRAADAVEDFGRAVPKLEKMDFEKKDPIGYANYLHDCVGAMKAVGMDRELQPYAEKAAKLRSKYPGRQADFRPKAYPVNCTEIETSWRNSQ